MTPADQNRKVVDAKTTSGYHLITPPCCFDSRAPGWLRLARLFLAIHFHEFSPSKRNTVE
jgi:hypothetical protein